MDACKKVQVLLWPPQTPRPFGRAWITWSHHLRSWSYCGRQHLLELEIRTCHDSETAHALATITRETSINFTWDAVRIMHLQLLPHCNVTFQSDVPTRFHLAKCSTNLSWLPIALQPRTIQWHGASSFQTQFHIVVVLLTSLWQPTCRGRPRRSAAISGCNGLGSWGTWSYSSSRDSGRQGIADWVIPN